MLPLPRALPGLLAIAASCPAIALPLDIRGELITSTCDVRTDNPTLTVMMGRVDLAEINGNARAGRKDFSVVLDCRAASGDQPLRLRFNGPRHAGTTHLALSPDSTAGNVGVAVFDAHDVPQLIGEPASTVLRGQRNDYARVDFSAWYSAPAGDATAGTANASAELVVVYP